MAKHRCPAPGCQRNIAAELFACRGHWFALSAPLRARIWRAYRRGDLADTLECHELAAAEWGADG